MLALQHLKWFVRLQQGQAWKVVSFDKVVPKTSTFKTSSLFSFTSFKPLSTFSFVWSRSLRAVAITGILVVWSICLASSRLIPRDAGVTNAHACISVLQSVQAWSRIQQLTREHNKETKQSGLYDDRCARLGLVPRSDRSDLGSHAGPAATVAILTSLDRACLEQQSVWPGCMMSCWMVMINYVTASMLSINVQSMLYTITNLYLHLFALRNAMLGV